MLIDIVRRPSIFDTFQILIAIALGVILLKSRFAIVDILISCSFRPLSIFWRKGIHLVQSILILILYLHVRSTRRNLGGPALLEVLNRARVF